MKKYLLLGLIALGCNTNKGDVNGLLSNPDDFTEAFDNVEYISISSEKVKLNSSNGIKFQSFSKMKFLDDLIIVHDFPGEDYIMKIIDLNTKEVSNFLKKGKGPNEVVSIIPPYSVDKKNNKLYVANGNTHFVYSVNSLKQGDYIPESKFKITLPEGRLQLSSYVNNGLMLGATRNKRFGLFNIETKEIISNYEYTKGFLVEQGHFLNHPSKMKAAYLQTYSAALTILDYTDSDITIKENIWWLTNNRQEKLANGNTTIVAGKNQRLSFLDSTVSEKYIYILYSGKPIGYGDLMAYKSNTVFVLDWGGNPINVFVLDDNVHSITIDESENNLYAGAEDEEGELSLVKYDLTKITH